MLLFMVWHSQGTLRPQVCWLQISKDLQRCLSLSTPVLKVLSCEIWQKQCCQLRDGSRHKIWESGSPVASLNEWNISYILSFLLWYNHYDYGSLQVYGKVQGFSAVFDEEKLHLGKSSGLSRSFHPHFRDHDICWQQRNQNHYFFHPGKLVSLKFEVGQ